MMINNEDINLYMKRFTNALGQHYLPDRFLTFDDILFQPKISPVSSRYNVSTTTQLAGIEYRRPFISANMDTITGVEMARKMRYLGGLGILHRFWNCESEYRDAILSSIKTDLGKMNKNPAFSIGLGKPSLMNMEAKESIGWIESVIDDCFKNYAENVILCLDIAHGDSDHAYERIEKIRDIYPLGGSVKLIAGNIATRHAAIRMYNAEVDAVKVGIGCGSVCQTRVVAGHGVPQASAVMNVRAALDYMQDTHDAPRPSIISDGGVRNPGDAFKALALGADMVMFGSLLSGTIETPGEIKDIDGVPHKMYRGQSSKTFMADANKDQRSSEGVAAYVPVKDTVDSVVYEVDGGIRSGMSYAGSRNLHELYQNSIPMEITHAGFAEGKPHILNGDNIYHGE